MRESSITTESRSCTKCGTEKPWAAFVRAGKSGIRTVCRPCWATYVREHKAKDPEHQREVAKAYRARRPDIYRNSILKFNYGITVVEYEKMLADQGGVCAVCGREETQRHNRTGRPRRLAVDHDHETGEVRGLLCAPCNQTIGLMDESPERLKAVIQYLQRNQ